MVKHLQLFLFFLGLSLTAIGQTKNITGIVKPDGLSVLGATIVEKEQQ
jgi:hypothetical protein